MENNPECYEVKELIEAYYDNELSTDESRLVKEHIEGCEICAQELANLKNLGNLIKNSSNNIECSVRNLDFCSDLKIHLDNRHVCESINDKLSPYIDKELTKDELMEISEHLLYCRFCRRDYENLKETQHILKDYFTRIGFGADTLPAIEKIVADVYKKEKISYLAGMFAASAALIILTWFSMNIIEPAIFKEAYKDHRAVTNKDKPLYVNAEDFLLKSIYSVPSEGAIAVAYDQE